MQSQTNHIMLNKHFGDNMIINLITHVEDIILTHDDLMELEKLKVLIDKEIEIKDLDQSRYFLNM